MLRSFFWDRKPVVYRKHVSVFCESKSLFFLLFCLLNYEIILSPPPICIYVFLSLSASKGNLDKCTYCRGWKISFEAHPGIFLIEKAPILGKSPKFKPLFMAPLSMFILLEVYFGRSKYRSLIAFYLPDWFHLSLVLKFEHDIWNWSNIHQNHLLLLVKMSQPCFSFILFLSFVITFMGLWVTWRICHCLNLGKIWTRTETRRVLQIQIQKRQKKQTHFWNLAWIESWRKIVVFSSRSWSLQVTTSSRWPFSWE